MRITKLSLHSSSLPAIAAALLVAGLAPAQASAQDSLAEEDPAAEPAEQIVVTGSRISVSAATESTSPITVIDAESIALSGQADLATQLPAVAMGWLARRRIGGQTGDILGAAQHLAETAMLITASTALT